MIISTEHVGLREAPTMPGLPVVGSAVDLLRRLFDTQLRAMHELGDVVRFSAGPPGARATFYSVYSPEGVHRVLAGASARYRKDNRLYAELRDVFGNGLLTSQDDTWLRQKRFVQPLFTHGQVREYVPTMAEEAAALVERWRTPALAGERVELHGEASRLTLRVVGRVLLGADLEDVDDLLRRALPALGENARRRGFAPVVTPSGWPTPANLRIRALRSRLHAVIDGLAAERRAGGDGTGDLMARLVGARDIGTPGADARLGDAEVRDQILVFLFAGHDTTATALTFALHLLGSHPDAQRLAHDEVRDVLAGRPPEVADLGELRYLTMVVKEALRLYPPVYGTGRRLTDEADDELAGYRIPRGTDVAVYPWVTHRHPRHWDDPEAFDPLRFTPEREGARHRYAWFPFGGGPRTCIGAHLAMTEVLTVLATVLQAYRVETPDRRIALVPRITLHPTEPVWASLTPR